LTPICYLAEQENTHTKNELKVKENKKRSYCAYIICDYAACDDQVHDET